VYSMNQSIYVRHTSYLELNVKSNIDLISCVLIAFFFELISVRVKVFYHLNLSQVRERSHIHFLP